MSFDTLIMDIEHGEYELFEKCLLPDKYFLKFNTIICEFHGHRPNDVNRNGKIFNPLLATCILPELTKYYKCEGGGKGSTKVMWFQKK